MDLDAYQNFFGEARRLVHEWRDIARVPRREWPACDQGVGREGRELRYLLAWSGNAYDASWPKKIHWHIGKLVEPDNGAWEYQSPFYANAFASFFGPCSEQFTLNAIIITRTRVPIWNWPAFLIARTRQYDLRPPSLEPPHVFQTPSISMRGLSTDLRLNLSDVLWAEAEENRNAKFGRGAILKQKVCSSTPLAPGMSQSECWLYDERQIFAMNFDSDEDRAILRRGSIPAVHRQFIAGISPGWVPCPRIELLRLNKYGLIDLLEIQTNNRGLLLDLTWGKREFEAFLFARPDIAGALRSALTSGEKL